MMTLSAYLRSRAGEALLVLASAWSMAIVAFNAFFLDGVAGRAAIALCGCAVLLAVLYVASFRRRWAAAGAVAFLAVVAAMVACALALSAGEDPWADAEGNYLYLVLVVAFASAGAFLLTRTLPGCAVWFLACAFACSVVQAFYEPGEVAASLCASSTALSLVVWRNFHLGAARADAVLEGAGARVAGSSGSSGSAVLEGATVAGAPGIAAAIASVAPVLLALGIAAVAWFAVIAPLSPGVLKVTLLTDYRQLPVVELRGVADKEPILDLSTTSGELVEGFEYTTDDLVTGQGGVLIDARELLARQSAEGGGGATAAGVAPDASSALDQDSPDAAFDPLSYSQQFPAAAAALLALGLAALLVVAYFMVRRRLRSRRLARMLGGAPAEQVRLLYLFLLGRFERLGMAVPDGATLAEYARDSAARMAAFDEEAGVAFAQLTSTYAACAYGGRDPSEDDIVPFVAYYLAFWKAARKHLGTMRYLPKSVRL